MYERFYHLRERPFALSPDPAYLYLSRVHREALDSIRYGIESAAGFIVVTGEIGAGKTTLIQSVLQRLDERTVIGRVVNTTLEPRELLEAIALDFGLNDTPKSKPALIRDLGLFLVDQRRQGRRPLLVIDEAQNLSAQALEEVRLLSNLETEKSKLLQILLAGQPNLRETIASPELEQFRQRVAVSYHLRPLDPNETAAYINYRLEHAALGEPLKFPEEASSLVHEVSGGVPRIINVVCDAALVFGYAEERHAIDRAMIEEVIGELEETGIVRRPARRPLIEPPAAHVTESAVESRSDTLARPPETPSVAPSRAVPAAPAMLQTTRVPPASSDTHRLSLAPEAAGVGTGASEPQARTPILVPPPEISARPATPVTPTSSAKLVSPPSVAAMSSANAGHERAVRGHGEALLQASEVGTARAELAGERELISRLQRELAAREQALLERERQVAEQRRIMGEEYRLLRQAQSARSTVPTSAAVAVANNRPRTQSDIAPALQPTFWQRVFRLFTGGHPVRS